MKTLLTSLSCAFFLSTATLLVPAPALALPPGGPKVPAAKSKISHLQPASGPARPTRQKFIDIFTLHHGDDVAMRRAFENATVPLAVKRICHVFGGHPSRVSCVKTEDLLSELQLSAGDRQLFRMGLNDMWESLGGAPAGGDLTACGGATATSLTSLTPTASGPSTPGGLAGKTGKAQTLTGAAASSKVSACRNSQTAGINGGIGLFTPGSPGYRDAVSHAQSFLTGIAGSCRDGDNSAIAAPGGSSSTPQMGVGEGLGWVAGATTDLIGAMDAVLKVGEACAGGKAKCALGVAGAVGAAVGLAADGSELVGAEGTAATVVGALDTGLDIVGGVIALSEAAALGTAAVAAADVVLPALAVFAGAYAVASPIGTASANVLDPLYVAAADYINGVDDVPAAPPKKTEPKPATKPDKGGGVGRPAEGGRPSCSAMAARAAAFNEYCSQAGNDWQSYDCMLFVARLNGCADPGVVRPAPGEDFQCQGPRSEAAKQQTACEQREKIRGFLSRPSGEGGKASKCAAVGAGLADFQQRQRMDLCTRVSVDDPGGFCDGIRASQSNQSNHR